MTQLTRKERDEARKKKEILAAALEVFAGRGFHGATMAEISKTSQYPLGTIYKYFPGKKEMYHDLVITTVQELGQILYEIRCSPNLSPVEKLHAALAAQARFYQANKEVARIYISERSNIDAVAMPKLNERVNHLHEKMVTLFREIIEQGIEKKEIKPLPSLDMAELFSDIVHSTAWASLFREEDQSSQDERLDLVFKMFTTGILHQ
mgnify:CR=1 FL=1